MDRSRLTTDARGLPIINFAITQNELAALKLWLFPLVIDEIITEEELDEWASGLKIKAQQPEPLKTLVHSQAANGGDESGDETAWWRRY